MHEALSALSAHPGVVHVDVASQPKHLNLQAAATLQSGPLAQPVDAPYASIASKVFPFWATGLDGSNQVSLHACVHACHATAAG